MKNFKVINGEKKLGYIRANNLSEVELLVAVNFPEDYFGCNIFQVDEEGNSFSGCDFSLIPVKEYFGENANAMEIAANNLVNRIRTENNLVKKEVSYDGTCYSFPKLESLLKSL